MQGSSLPLVPGLRIGPSEDSLNQVKKLSSTILVGEERGAYEHPHDTFF